MAGITTITGGKISDAITWAASNSIPAQQPLNQGDTVATSFSFSTANANNAVGGADEIVSFLQVIAASGSATINLLSVLNILQQAGVALARIKGYKMRLLGSSGNQGAVDTVNGTKCTSVTVGGGPNACTLEMNAAGTFTINNGGSHQHFDPSAAGFSLVSPSAKNILVTNNDAVNAAAFQLTLIGATT